MRDDRNGSSNASRKSQVVEVSLSDQCFELEEIFQCCRRLLLAALNSSRLINDLTLTSFTIRKVRYEGLFEFATAPS